MGGYTAHDIELEANIAAYEKLKGELERYHMGKIALLSAGKYIESYNDFEDAYKIGMKDFGAGKFSLTRIGEKPKFLGIGSFAL